MQEAHLQVDKSKLQCTDGSSIFWKSLNKQARERKKELLMLLTNDSAQGFISSLGFSSIFASLMAFQAERVTHIK